MLYAVMLSIMTYHEQMYHDTSYHNMHYVHVTCFTPPYPVTVTPLPLLVAGFVSLAPPPKTPKSSSLFLHDLQCKNSVLGLVEVGTVCPQTTFLATELHILFLNCEICGMPRLIILSLILISYLHPLRFWLPLAPVTATCGWGETLSSACNTYTGHLLSIGIDSDT